MALPTIALFTGDPAGIGPELVQKLLQDQTNNKAAHIILIGQKDSLQTVSHAHWHDWSGYNTPAFKTATADAHHGASMISALAEGAA